MRISIVTILIFILSGCAPVKRSYYLPTSIANQSEGYVCGAVPFGGYKNSIAPGIGLFVSGTTIHGSAEFSFQFAVEKNHTLELTSRLITISGEKMESITAELEMLNQESNQIGKPIVITSQNKNEIYFANVSFKNTHQNTFTMSIPPFKVDSKEIEIEPIIFELKVKKGVMACIQ